MRSRLVDRARRADAGFTLLEVLVAIALFGLIMGTLAAVTAQWLPSWNRGLVRAQRNEQLAIALDRLVGDLAAAEFVSSNAKNVLLFRGTERAVVFVRSAIGPNRQGGLEIVRIAETADSRGPVLVRTRAPFAILPTANSSAEAISFGDPVVLLRAPLRLSFSYAGPDGQWNDSWSNSGALPTAVRFDVVDVDRGLVVSTAAKVHVDMEPPRPEPPPNDAPPRQGDQASSNKGPT